MYPGSARGYVLGCFQICTGVYAGTPNWYVPWYSQVVCTRVPRGLYPGTPKVNTLLNVTAVVAATTLTIDVGSSLIPSLAA